VKPAVPNLAWTDDGVPYAPAFDDTYFARGNGLGETRQVFLAGNGLPERWRDAGDFTIAELGFATGLNFVETWRQWRESAPPDGRLTYVGFERFPLDADQMRRVLERWPELAALAAPLLRRWPPGGADTTWRLDPSVRLRLILGDANATLPEWTGAADAWYLDGFAPAKNPELWNAPLMPAGCAATSRPPASRCARRPASPASGTCCAARGRSGREGGGGAPPTFDGRDPLRPHRAKAIRVRRKDAKHLCQQVCTRCTPRP